MTQKQLPPGAVGYGTHQPGVLKGIAWPVCSHCGLVYLKNEATRQRIKDGCVIWKDEQKRSKS